MRAMLRASFLGISALLLGLFGACKGASSAVEAGGLAGAGGTVPNNGVDLNLAEGGASNLAGAADHGQGPSVPACEGSSGSLRRI